VGDNIANVVKILQGDFDSEARLINGRAAQAAAAIVAFFRKRRLDGFSILLLFMGQEKIN
jgi:hypothetical protein